MCIKNFFTYVKVLYCVCYFLNTENVKYLSILKKNLQRGFPKVSLYNVIGK